MHFLMKVSIGDVVVPRFNTAIECKNWNEAYTVASKQIADIKAESDRANVSAELIGHDGRGWQKRIVR